MTSVLQFDIKITLTDFLIMDHDYIPVISPDKSNIHFDTWQIKFANISLFNLH